MPAWSTSSTATVRALSGLLSRVLRASMFSGAREMRVFEFSASRGKRNIGRATAATNRRISAQNNSPEIMKQTPFANFPLATEIFQSNPSFSFSFAYQINLHTTTSTTRAFPAFRPGRADPPAATAARMHAGVRFGTGEHKAVAFDWTGVVPCVALLSCAHCR